MNKICVYTCITGDYDDLRDVEKEKNIDYICFTNNKKIKSNTWKIIYIEDNTISNQMLARKIKILGSSELKKYDILVWIDGSTYIKTSLNVFLNNECDLETYDLITFNHHERESISEEAAYIVKLKKDSLENVNKLLNFFKEEKFENSNHLVQSNVIVKNNKSKKIKSFLGYWYLCVSDYCVRDQLSFNYAEWKSQISVKRLNLSMIDNEYFMWDSSHSKNKILNDRYKAFCVVDGKYLIDNIIERKYEISNNTYIIKFNSPSDCEKIDILLDIDQYAIIKNISEQEIYNCIRLENYFLVYNNPLVVIKRKIKKNELIKVSFDIENINFDEFSEILRNVNHKLSIVKDDNINLKSKLIMSEDKNNSFKRRIDELHDENNKLYQENVYLAEENKKVVNSKTWKLHEKLYNIKNKFRF